MNKPEVHQHIPRQWGLLQKIYCKILNFQGFISRAFDPGACLKNAFCEMCFTLSGEFIPNL